MGFMSDKPSTDTLEKQQAHAVYERHADWFCPDCYTKNRTRGTNGEGPKTGKCAQPECKKIVRLVY